MAKIDDLVQQLAEDAGPVRPAPHPFVLGLKWTVAALVYVAAAVAVSGPRPDLLSALQHPWYAAELAALVAVLVTTGLSAAVLAYPDMHQKAALALSPVGAFALFVPMMFLAWHAAPPTPLPAHSYQCTVSIILVSLPPAGWLLHAMRRLASTHFTIAGAIALLSAFSTGALWLRLHEVNDSIIHVIDWHYLPMLAVGIAGLWLGRKLLRW